MNLSEFNRRALIELVPIAEHRGISYGETYEEHVIQDKITIDSETYESLIDKSGYTQNQYGTYTKRMLIELPSKEVFEAKVVELINAESNEVRDNIVVLARKKIIKKRNKLLIKTDFLAVSDYPFPSDEIKQAWVRYRQALRDLPVTGISVDPENQYRLLVTWPTPPIWPANVV
tara:strand:- start:3 stop:524 length:522 start_codon:yes stop_codon:yes gene_type:complete